MEWNKIKNARDRDLDKEKSPSPPLNVTKKINLNKDQLATSKNRRNLKNGLKITIN